MNPIEFGADLFAKAKEMQTKTVKALEIIAKIDEELSTMPEPFKMDLMCLITKAVDKCENMNNARKVTPTEKVGQWLCSDDMFEYAVCSRCKEDIGEPFEYAKKHFKYCSQCGAKMGGEQNESN